MSKLPRHQFPSLDKAPTAPAWLNQKGTATDGVQTLVSVLQGGEPPRQPMPQPQAAPSPPPEPPPEPIPPPVDYPEEPYLSKLPGPPRLGSLLPGGRSNPPPANDRDNGLQERVHAFANAAIELAIARTASLGVLEGQLLDLAIEVAEAVIEREVEADRTLHAALARAALQSLGSDTRSVTLRTSHDGYTAITAALGGDDVELRGIQVHIVADMDIPGLGCIVEGDNVRVDATVSERLHAVRRAFEEERRRAQERVE